MRGLSIVWLLSTAPVAAAAPMVIYDSGRTLPLRPYLSAVTIQPAARRPSSSPGKVGQPLVLPIRTPELTPGRLAAVQLPAALAARLQALPRPVFVFGADALSRRWLVQHRTRLLELGAVGLLVEVGSVAELAALRRLGAGLVIVPVAGGTLARTLGLRHYPMLISTHGVEQ